MAKFQLSSFGRLYVTDEQLSSLPVWRVVFMVTTLAFGLFVIYRTCYYFYKLWTDRKRSPIITLLFTTFTASALIHTFHYADNIMRPVDYLEPKWLYEKYVLSTMEITFAVNFPILIVGYLCATKLLTAMVSGESSVIKRYCLLFTFYIIGSLLTLGHYRTEPPLMFSRFVNFTIAGEGFATICLVVVLARIYYLNKHNMFGGPERDLAKLLAVNYDDSDEEIVTFRKVEMEKLPRKRSQEKLN